ncbi:MAG: Efflux transporter, RND family, MFP subunit, partial [Candidatus Daviesbacteria bacterium GW2011_GWA2_42_7]
MRKVLKLLLEHRKITFAFIIVIILVILHGRLLFLQSTSSNQLQLTEVKRQDIKVIVSTSGIFTGKDTASLHFKSSGKLAYINAKIGDQVFSGQVLAGLDTQELAIQLQQAN